ncbi:MAG: arsenate reductase ArsC [Anaerococcus sp.]|nr:arsenate reductase ArsC [Anaerococcus sp.]
MSEIKVAFVCVHNSCRSQIAEALSKKFAKDTFKAYSAGTKLKDKINQDAVRIVKEIYGIDMEKDQRPKLIDDLPKIHILITMGCNVTCPALPASFVEDWGLDDPSGQSDEVFKEIIQKIEEKVKDLKERIQKGQIKVS